jgi:hypothetical protein
MPSNKRQHAALASFYAPVMINATIGVSRLACPLHNITNTMYHTKAQIVAGILSAVIYYLIIAHTKITVVSV